MMNGISLFSGIGGIELALHKEVKTVAYIEREPYAQAVLIKRMQGGQLDHAPIYDDVRTFNGRLYRGQVDIVFGGFPCQDISNAGKGAGIKEGTRSGLFFELMRVVGEVRPTFIFLENVAAINRRGLDIVLGEISKAGYDARWMHLRASDVGARHRRERWFCLAYLSDSECNGWTKCKTIFKKKRNTKNNNFSTFKGWMSGGWSRDPAEQDSSSESFVGRVADGISKRVDRLKCLGNAVVPQQGRKAWQILTNDLSDSKLRRCVYRQAKEQSAEARKQT